MSNPFLPLAGLSLAVLAAGAIAQSPAANSPQVPTRAAIGKVADTNFQALDTNKDGSLTAAEIDAGQARHHQTASGNVEKLVRDRFNKLDTDKNGQLSFSEFRANAPTVRPPAAKASPMMLQKRDTNKDGRITAEEFRSLPLTAFDKADTNRDGTLSRAEGEAAVRQARTGAAAPPRN